MVVKPQVRLEPMEVVARVGRKVVELAGPVDPVVNGLQRQVPTMVWSRVPVVEVVVPHIILERLVRVVRPAWVVLGRLARHIVSAFEDTGDWLLVLAIELQNEVMAHVDAVHARQKGSG